MGSRPFSRYHHLLWVTALVLLASVTFLVAACGNTSGTGTPTPTAAQQTPAPTTAQQTPAPTTSSGGYSVSMVANGGVFAFSPATLTVPKGTTVTWTNKSVAPHTVTSDNDAFTASSTLSQNQTFQTTFTTAGTFAYHCSIHSYMKATIIVTG